MANRQKRIHKEVALLEKEKQFRSRFKKEKEKRKEGLRPALDIFIRAENKSAFRKVKNRKQLYRLFEQVRLLKKRKRQGHQLFFEILKHPKILFDDLLSYQKLAEACGRLTVCRELQTWKMPKSKKEVVVFKSLFFHLFVQYKIPNCIEGVIANMLNPYYTQVEEGMMYEIVSGKGVHQVAGLGITMNSKMNFYFQESPDFLNTPQAMWWAKLRTMGMSPSVAHRIVYRVSIGISVKWSQWLDDFVFFIKRNDTIPTKDFKKILDFILCQMNGGKVLKIKGIDDNIDVPALFPKFKFKGRSVASVLRFVKKWEDYIQLARESGSNKAFRDSKFQPMKIEHADGLILIRQVKTLKDLVVEGNQMGHCVATYASYCISGESSIWSMRRISPAGKMKKLLTIEVGENETKLLEARGKCNRSPKRIETTFLKQWTGQNGIEYEE